MAGMSNLWNHNGSLFIAKNPLWILEEKRNKAMFFRGKGFQNRLKLQITRHLLSIFADAIFDRDDSMCTLHSFPWEISFIILHNRDISHFSIYNDIKYSLWLQEWIRRDESGQDCSFQCYSDRNIKVSIDSFRGNMLESLNEKHKCAITYRPRR